MPEPQTGKSRQKRITLIFASIAAILALDQWTKVIAIDHLRGLGRFSYWGDFFRLQYAENTGAFLSLGSSLSPETRFWLLSVIVGLFLVGILVYLILRPELEWLQTAAFTMILGGGFSNLLDRIFRASGHVVDFMNMGIGPVRTGIFNVADVFIMAGITIAFLAKPSRHKKSLSPLRD